MDVIVFIQPFILTLNTEVALHLQLLCDPPQPSPLHILYVCMHADVWLTGAIFSAKDVINWMKLLWL